MVGPDLEQATQLYNLHKYSLAIKVANQVLAHEPRSAEPHAVKALAYMAQKKRQEALGSALQAVSLEPDDSYNHYVLSLVHINLTKDFPAAEKAVKEALRLNPQDADLYNALAQLRIIKGKLPEALSLCDQALKIDPQNSDCTGTRARVLTKLGRRGEAVQNIDGAMRRDPQNPQTLANTGWVKLEMGDYQGSLIAFREALRMAPDFEYARSGMLQALKAKRLVFRLYLKYSFWLQKLVTGARWLLVFGALLLISLTDGLPALQPLVGLYILFVLSTWLINPLQNLLLSFDKYGRFVLTRVEFITAILVPIVLLLSMATFLVAASVDIPMLFGGAAALFLLVIPLSGLVKLHDEKPMKFKKALVATIFLASLVTAGFLSLPFNLGASLAFFIVSLFGVSAFSWMLFFSR